MNTKFEIRRKIMHIVIGILALCLLLAFGWQFAIVLLLGSIIFLILAKKSKLKIIRWLIDKFERDDKKQKLPGFALFSLLFGISASYILFPVDIALASAMVSILGDSTAALIGNRIGKTRIYGKKTLQGTLGGFIFSFFGALLFLPLIDAVFISIIGMLFELLCPQKWDDNIFVPVASGIILVIKRLI